MRDLSLHIMDLIENSLRADATIICIELVEDIQKDRLTLEIEDNGQGMDTQTLANALDPFFSTKRGHRTGLGLPLLAQATREAEGCIRVDSQLGSGTLIHAEFKRSHPDCKPLGEMEKTIRLLEYTHPECYFRYRCTLIQEQGD